MQGGAGDAPVLVRGPNDEELAWGNVGGRELPLGKRGSGVGQRPPIQVHRAASRIVNFNPVRVSPKIVGNGYGVLGHELRNADVGIGARRGSDVQRERANRTVTGRVSGG